MQNGPLNQIHTLRCTTEAWSLSDSRYTVRTTVLKWASRWQHRLQRQNSVTFNT